jgi:prepilin-type N-terminal cleavage/methylation domain-containing protein
MNIQEGQMHTTIRNHCGLTILELVIVLAVIGVLTAVAVPNVMSYLPEARLKSAARDLYSNLMLAKINAVKKNTSWAVVFDVNTNTYQVFSDKGADNSWANTADNILVKAITLSDYGSNVTYGNGSATQPIGTTFGNFVTYSSPTDVAVLNSRGTSNSGYVYLTNAAGDSCYGVGTLSSGVVILRKL